ncbi:MAG: hypothetical protein V8S58_10000 [Lachnospiraceae bacterium]
MTERAVFQLIDHKMTLIEIAPGIDLQKDVSGSPRIYSGYLSGLKRRWILVSLKSTGAD